MPSPHAPGARSPRAAAAMIAVAAAAAFLATFNETFLNVALTPIMADLGVDVATVQWLATGYLLVAAVLVPVANTLYHRFSTRPLFAVTVGLLVAGSIVGALAPSFGVLLAGRLLQAIGTGLLTPIGMNITLAVAPRAKLGMAMGIMAAMTTLGPSVAIIASGALLSIAPWTTLMWVFGALAMLVLLSGAVLLRNVAELGRPVLDAASFLLFAIAMVGLLYGISTAFSGPALPAAGAAAVGLLALALFVRRQGRIEHPLLDLRPFRSTPFVLGVAMTMLGLLFVFAMNVVIPIFLQSVKEQTPLGASLTLAPAILLTVAMGPVAGRLFDRHGLRVITPLGFGTMAVFIVLVGVAAGHPSIMLFGLLYIPAVLATSLVVGPAQTFALSHLDRATSPHGVTVVSTSFHIAGCLGTSLGIGVYNAALATRIDAGASAVDAASFGFRGSVLLVAVASVIGVVLALTAVRSSRAARAARGTQNGAAAPASQQADRIRTVSELMETEVFSLQPSQSALEALRMFIVRGISGAPVIAADGTLSGFLSDGDVMRYLSAEHPSSVSIYSFATGEDENLETAVAALADVSVGELATHDVITLDDDATIADAVAALAELRLKKVPVTRGHDGRVLGVVSRSAIHRLAVASYLDRHGGAPADTAQMQPA